MLQNYWWQCYFLLVFIYLVADFSKRISEDLNFIYDAKVVKGFLTETGFMPGKCDEYGCENDIELASYNFKIKNDNKTYEGQSGITREIFDNVSLDNLPYPIEIEYLPYNPENNRIFGTGLKNYYEILKYYWLEVLGKIILFILAS